MRIGELVELTGASVRLLCSYEERQPLLVAGTGGVNGSMTRMRSAGSG